MMNVSLLATAFIAFSIGAVMSWQYSQLEISKLMHATQRQADASTVISQSIQDHILADRNVSYALNSRIDHFNKKENKAIDDFRVKHEKLLEDIKGVCSPQKARR